VTALLCGLGIFVALAVIYAVLARLIGLPRLKVQEIVADTVGWVVGWLSFP
jgi:hypothetical protein